MSEKAIAIGWYAVASGIFVVFGSAMPVMGSRKLTNLLTKDLFEIVGGGWAFEDNPVKAAHLMIEQCARRIGSLNSFNICQRILLEKAHAHAVLITPSCSFSSWSTYSPRKTRKEG